MFGAVIGDVVGSRFEFDRGGKTKRFELFTEDDCFTDDSVMTVAVLDALMNIDKDASEKEVKEALVKSMQAYGRKYPSAGYGYRFYDFVLGNNPKPYNSFGNGSAMRVSSVGWLYDSLEKTIEVAKWSAEVSHNHPEGIKGATCTAAIIYLARTGKSKEEIERYLKKNYDYDFSETLNQMRLRHEHVETCMDSLPKAIRSFLDSYSYEDAIRNAISLGGDTDTLAAITGAMAQAYYGIPEQLIHKVIPYLPQDLLNPLIKSQLLTNNRKETK